MDYVYFFLKYEPILLRKLLLSENAFCINDLLNFQAGTYREKEIIELSIALAFSYSYVHCPIVVRIRLVYLR